MCSNHCGLWASPCGTDSDNTNRRAECGAIWFVPALPTVPKNTGSDWALVDSAGKFLGLLDSSRLLQFLAINQGTIAAKNSGSWDVVRLLPLHVETLGLR